MADRHYGIGCDQVLLLESPTRKTSDFKLKIFNSDGGEASQCGNGARCMGRFVREEGLSSKSEIFLETVNRAVKVKFIKDEIYEADMGIPEFEPRRVPLNCFEKADFYNLKVENVRIEIGAINMGNTHAITTVNDISKAEVVNLGSKIESHSCFPLGTNVEFMQVVSRDLIQLRIFERGAGETLACGSGACAAVVYGIQRGWLNEAVTVEVPGGELNIKWEGGTKPVILSGLTARVFEGTINI